MDKIKNECKGCGSCGAKIMRSCRAGLKPHLKSGDCPCLTCLIKGICTIVCEDFTQYRNKYNDRLWDDVLGESNGK